MKEKESLEPRDSTQVRKKGKQVVKRAEDKDYERKDADMGSPALKRKFSEQPPTKRNSRT
ncbi:hypothetical protein ACFOET_07725 [Parapedobacter deserti]|uniref:Uncharacterized protein n=1 Tax=Parapedobacter deserti TaxID=1912957 RepID=A0ABV7JHP4_9SPHI